MFPQGLWPEGKKHQGVSLGCYFFSVNNLAGFQQHPLASHLDWSIPINPQSTRSSSDISHDWEATLTMSKVASRYATAFINRYLIIVGRNVTRKIKDGVMMKMLRLRKILLIRRWMKKWMKRLSNSWYFIFQLWFLLKNIRNKNIKLNLWNSWRYWFGIKIRDG